MRLQINQEISMPLGKLVSQMAHSYCALVLGCFDFNTLSFRCNIDHLINAIKESEISLSSIQEMNQSTIQIVDQAHTVFNHPTLTTALMLTNDELNQFDFKPHTHEVTSHTDVRMIMIVNQQYRKSINKSCFIAESSQLYAKYLIQLLMNLKENNDIPRDNLMQWCNGSFAKITLNSNDTELSQKLTIPFLEYNSYIIVGPISKEQQGILSQLKLL